MEFRRVLFRSEIFAGGDGLIFQGFGNEAEFLRGEDVRAEVEVVFIVVDEFEGKHGSRAVRFAEMGRSGAAPLQELDDYARNCSEVALFPPVRDARSLIPRLRSRILLMQTNAPATVRGRYRCSLNWLCTCFTLRSFGPAEFRRDPQDDIALCRHDAILPRWGVRRGGLRR